MKKKIKYIVIIVLVIAAAIGWDTVRYARTEDRKPVSEMIVATYDVDKIRVSPEAETLVIVQANPEAADTTGILFAYSRTPGADGTMSAWKDELVGMPVKLGRCGTGKTSAGDGKTPVGFYDLNTPFGISAPQDGFPAEYVQLTDSMYWDKDGASPTYNRLVDENGVTGFRRDVSDHLIEGVPEHTYCLNIGYNAAGDKDAGAAVFLQCFDREAGSTDGCVATDEETMQTVLRLYKEGKTLILIEEKGRFSQYY